MYVRTVNGRCYLAETERIDGRVVQRHLGLVNSEWLELLAARKARRT
jgi:hypothetical protein